MRKHPDQAEMADHRQLAGLLKNTDDAVIAGDGRFVITAWNQSAERMLGWRADEVVGRPGREVLRMRLSGVERTALIRELTESGRWRGDLTVTHKDGSAVETELTAFALRAGRNELTGYLAIHRDLGERRRAEEALRAANLRAETILESITDAFVAVDHEWRYTYVNDLGLRRMQDKKSRSLTRADVVGKHMWDLFPDFVGTEIYDSYQEAMRERRPVSLQTYFERTEEWLEAHIYPSDTGLAIYYHNVSDRHLAEQGRREARRQADQREEERDRIDRATVETITPREREILQLLADGLGSRAIADRLNITVRTQRNHMTNILSKLGVHSQLQALVFALRYEVVAIR